MAPDAKTDFFFEENVVGYFEKLPSWHQPLKYMPYRSFGHWRFVQALSSGAQRCSYVINGEKHYFIVAKRLSYGLLEVAKTP